LTARKAAASRPAGRILFGPAGWSYDDWAGIVYPARKSAGFHEAAYLAQYFDTIEINTSFYHPLRPAHCWQWLEKVAGNPRFLFTVKLWQRFTHETGATKDDERAVREGFDLLLGAEKLGAVLLQFPFSFHNTPENVEALRKLLQQFRAYPLAVEVRHASWNEKSFYSLLEEHHAAFCNIDQPMIGKSLEPSDKVTARIGYVRLHGRREDTWFSDDPAMPPSERYNYLYSLEELTPWAARIRKVAARAETTFVITNNHFQGKAIANALQLAYLVTGQKVKIPEPLRSHFPQLESIASEPRQEPTLFPNPPALPRRGE
jgi:uncharacterized protein YecE (DUF72 family)